MTTSLGAPALTTSGEVGRCSAHRVPVYPSEAFIVACVLAELSSVRGSIRFMNDDQVRTRVALKLASSTHEAILAWTERVDRAEHPGRWNAARTAVTRFYPQLPGVEALPVYSDAFTDCDCG